MLSLIVWSPDLVWVPALCWLVCSVGRSMIGTDVERRNRGYKVAAGCMIVFAMVMIVVEWPSSSRALVWVTVRALLGYWLVLGLAWIGFAVEGAIREHLEAAREEKERIAREERLEREAEYRRMNPIVRQPEEKPKKPGPADKIQEVLSEKQRIAEVLGRKGKKEAEYWADQQVRRILGEGPK